MKTNFKILQNGVKCMLWWELVKLSFRFGGRVTEWLPISSTGHMILVEEFIKLNASEAFKNVFVVIQLGCHYGRSSSLFP